MNKVFLTGKMTRDIELKYMTSGTAFASFGLAVKRKIKNKETGKYEADFIECEAWSNPAEWIANNYGQKGDTVSLSGRMVVDKWEDKETGKNRYKTKVVLEELYFEGCSGKSNKPIDATQVGDGGDIPF